MPWCMLSAYYDLLMKLKYAAYQVREINDRDASEYRV